MRKTNVMLRKITALITVATVVFVTLFSSVGFGVTNVQADPYAVSNGDITNGGFESGLDSYWQVEKNAYGSVVEDTAETYEGSRSLKLEADKHFVARTKGF